MADQHVRRIEQAVLGLTVRYVLVPAATGVPAVGVVLTSGAGAFGARVDLIAAAAVAVEFWICGFNIDTVGVAQVFEVDVEDATPAILTSFRIHPTAVTPNLGTIPAGPYPIYMVAGSQVQGHPGGAAVKVIGVSTLYATAL